MTLLGAAVLVALHSVPVRTLAVEMDKAGFVAMKDVYTARIVYAALSGGDAAAVKALLAAGIDAHTRDDNGVTLVMRAAMSGDPDTVRVVIEAGGDRTARDLGGRNAADRVRDLLAGEPDNPKLAAILRLLTDE